MKKLVFIAICVFGFYSCGSSKPCGLANTTKQTNQKHQVGILSQVQVTVP